MEKLEITPLGLDNQPITAQSFKVQFNPNSHSVSKTVAWSPQYATPKRNAPRLRFNSAQGRSLTMASLSRRSSSSIWAVHRPSCPTFRSSGWSTA